MCYSAWLSPEALVPFSCLFVVTFLLFNLVCTKYIALLDNSKLPFLIYVSCVTLSVMSIKFGCASSPVTPVGVKWPGMEPISPELFSFSGMTFCLPAPAAPRSMLAVPNVAGQKPFTFSGMTFCPSFPIDTPGVAL